MFTYVVVIYNTSLSRPQACLNDGKSVDHSQLQMGQADPNELDYKLQMGQTWHTETLLNWPGFSGFF